MQGTLEKVLGNWEESEEGGGGGRASSAASASDFSTCLSFIFIMLIALEEPPYRKPCPANSASRSRSLVRSSTRLAHVACCSRRRSAHVL